MIKVLIADDDHDLRELCTRFLEIKEYVSLGAASRVELYEKILDFSPHVILLDVMFGDDDGREICKHLKAHFAGVKVILVSAREDLLHMYQSFGADYAIPKPYTIDMITVKINELLS